MGVDLAVPAQARLVPGQPCAHVVDGDPVRANGHPQVARARDDRPRRIAVRERQRRSAREVLRAGLRQLLVDDAVEFLPGVEVIVAVEDRGDAVANEQRVDRQAPAWPPGGEALRPVGIAAAPLLVRRRLDAAAHLALEPAEHEDPAVAVAPGPRVPVRIEHDEQRVAPRERVVRTGLAAAGGVFPLGFGGQPMALGGEVAASGLSAAPRRPR